MFAASQPQEGVHPEQEEGERDRMEAMGPILSARMEEL